MRRTSFIPHDQDREDQLKEEKAERRALRKAPIEDDEDPLAAFEGLDPRDPEFESVEEFGTYLLDDSQTEFDHRHLACLAVRTGKGIQNIRRELESFGFTLKRRAVVRATRGFKANNHNLYEGNPMAGGGGGGSIYGMVD